MKSKNHKQPIQKKVIQAICRSFGRAVYPLRDWIVGLSIGGVAIVGMSLWSVFLYQSYQEISLVTDTGEQLFDPAKPQQVFTDSLQYFELRAQLRDEVTSAIPVAPVIDAVYPDPLPAISTNSASIENEPEVSEPEQTPTVAN